MKDYLEVSLHTMVKVLEIMDELKFEAKKIWEGTISELHRNINYNINMDYVLVCTHDKLNFGVHKSKT
jgi:hypothetical protein